MSEKHTNTQFLNLTTTDLQALKKESSTLQGSISSLRASEDRWNTWNRALAIVAVSTATLFGLLSWGSQVLASRNSSAQRPLSDHRDKVEGRIRELLDQDAQSQIATATSQGNEANAKAEEAKQKAEQARLAQVKLTQENLILQSQIKQGEIALAQLNAKYSSRHLSDEQRTDLIRILKKLPAPHTKILVQVFTGTPDGIPYALEIISAINEAGWQAEFEAQTTGYGELRGVRLIVSDQTIPHWLKFFQDALEEVGIGGEGALDSNLEKGKIILVIAPKL